MANTNKDTDAEVTSNYRFSLYGLILFSLCLMAATAVISSRLYNTTPKVAPVVVAKPPAVVPDVQVGAQTSHKGPWGELITQDIKLERPIEYISPEAKDPQPETWAFHNMDPAQVEALLAARGLTQEQAASQITSNRVNVHETTTYLTPDEDFLLSLPSETRAKLYGSLFGMGVGPYFDSPLIFPNRSIETLYTTPGLNPEDVALLKRLVYPVGNSDRLTDYHLLLRKIPDADRRLVMAKELTKQPAVLVRLHIGPGTDIDKVAAYWGNMENVRFTDLQPMLTALKELPVGGDVSLMYLLPPFARSRLYTYPLPPRPGDPEMDCHWSTFNFSSAEPDNRFNDPKYLSESLQKNFYRIESPARYGDVVMFSNSKNIIKHSGVFLADDLYFTKYGNKYQQPWMIVHLADMQAMYPTVKPQYYRRATQ